MKKILIILVVMLGSLESQAQKISHIETTKSWYYMAGKIAAMTFMQYVNFVNHRPIGQIMYSLI